MTSADRERWACQECGRLYASSEAQHVEHPECPICGCLLRRWSTFRVGALILFGAMALPLVGRALVEVASVFGSPSPVLRSLIFLGLPILMAVLGTFEFASGCASGHVITKRAGQQLLWLSLGFAVAVLALAATGLYSDVAGTR